jgi:CheY-like chemotaxis protein
MLSSATIPFEIIMVEDDLGHAHLIKKNLERAGICNKITHFDNGKSALDFFFGENNNLDVNKLLVLLDLNLPEVDGYEILKRLKHDQKTENIPVIILTTTDNPREVDKCYELGCNAYISKPVEYDNFSEAIQKLGLLLAIVKLPHVKHD